MSTIEEIQKRSETLPEPLAKEVLDFLIFVSNRHESESAMPAPSFKSLRGSWKGRLSTSDAFAKAKSAEKLLER